jgi:hypothetical protein
VFLTTVSWWCFLRFRRTASRGLVIGYAVVLAAMVYTHPLAVFMIAAHVAAYLATRAGLKLSWGGWLGAMALAAVLCGPWLGNYLDHPPDVTTARPPPRDLLAVPIEYIGGNSLMLLPMGLLVGHGWLQIGGGRARARTPRESLTFAIWFGAPIGLLYGYSWIGHPIFGPARYHLFVAPAYLILVARGLVVLPRGLALVLLGLMAGLSAETLTRVGYAPGPRNDWRGVARWLDETGIGRAEVFVDTQGGPWPNTQLEAARYYLAAKHTVELGGPDEAGRGAGRRVSVRCLPAEGGTPAAEPRAGEVWFQGLAARLDE